MMPLSMTLSDSGVPYFKVAVFPEIKKCEKMVQERSIVTAEHK